MSLLKNNSKNVFRNISKNIRSVLRTDKNDEDKISILETVLNDTKFNTFDRFFYRHPSYNQNFDKDRWELCPNFAKNLSDNDAHSRTLNPWFVYMHDFIMAMTSERSSAAKIRDLEIATDYFYADKNREDWVRF